MSSPAQTSFTARPPVNPYFLYGTAWKEERSQRLTELAIEQGFRRIDTANQRKHYHEAGVGQAIRAVFQRALLARRDLFLQTKFTFQGGQDHRLPYQPHAPIATQVQQSFASSLDHLGVDYVDSYVLHGPTQRVGLGAADWEAWRAMEELQLEGKVHHLGISNVSLEQLQTLCHKARVPPRFVQNRCFAARAWDRAVREFCQQNGLTYQGFSLLTANTHVLEHPKINAIAQRLGASVIQVVFRFALDVGMLPLTGTSDATHMRDDLQAAAFSLTPEEVQTIEAIG